MENVAENLTAINKTFENLNGIMREVADTMPKPASKFISVLETIVLIFSIFGIVGIADIIIKWFTGG
jgi:hypothetical protein